VRWERRAGVVRGTRRRKEPGVRTRPDVTSLRSVTLTSPGRVSAGGHAALFPERQRTQEARQSLKGHAVATV
jgi:hypothetical protein